VIEIFSLGSKTKPSFGEIIFINESESWEVKGRTEKTIFSTV